MTDKKNIHNAIGHFDISGPDIEQLKTFYSAVFGWSVENKGPGYALLKTPARSVQGALVDSDVASLTMGVVVPDLDLALKHATAAGGSVVMPKIDNGWVKKGQVADPAGNTITLIQA